MLWNKWILTGLLALPLTVAGIVYTTAGKAEPAKAGYTCPVTGGQLPCPKCCPLNQKK